MKNIEIDPMLVLIISAICFFVGVMVMHANQSSVEHEAIKAGLVQDSAGHWVKPLDQAKKPE